MPARVNKIRHDENTRLKIKANNIIARLNKLIAGEIKMESHAVSAALGLLKKVLPDLSAVEHSGEVSTTYVVQSDLPMKTIDEWAKDNLPRLQ